MAKIHSNPPSANILMNSMRSMGYSFEAAIADIVDNSISANASIIWIDFPVSSQKEPYVTVLDNGTGDLSSCPTPEGNAIPLPSSAVDVTVGRRSRRTSTSYTRAHQVLWLSEDKAQGSDRAEVRPFDGARLRL